MSLLSKLFGGGPKAEPVQYEGFLIYPEPALDGGRFRIGARIEKTVNDQLMTHKLIRVDTLESREAAEEASVGKAKQLIDEQGERLFR